MKEKPSFLRENYPGIGGLAAIICMCIACYIIFNDSSLDDSSPYDSFIGVILSVFVFFLFTSALRGIIVAGFIGFFISLEFYPDSMLSIHLLNTALGAALMGLGYLIEYPTEKPSFLRDTYLFIGGLATIIFMCIYGYIISHDSSSDYSFIYVILSVSVFCVFTSAWAGIIFAGFIGFFMSLVFFPDSVPSIHLFNMALGAALTGVGYFVEWRQSTPGQDKWQPEPHRAQARRKQHDDEWQPEPDRVQATRKQHDDEWQPEPEQDEEEQVIDFFTAAFSVMGHICKADGHICKDEIIFAREHMTEMDLSSEQKKEAITLFNLGKQSDFPLDDFLRQFKQSLDLDASLKRTFIEIQCYAAGADGVVHPAERALLRRVCTLLYFSLHELESILESVEAEHHQQTDTQESCTQDPYAVLGVSTEATNEEVKRAYRQLMKEYHPDKMASKGLPEQMMNFANEHTAKIRLAYDQIKQKRRF